MQYSVRGRCPAAVTKTEAHNNLKKGFEKKLGSTNLVICGVVCDMIILGGCERVICGLAQVRVT